MRGRYVSHGVVGWTWSPLGPPTGACPCCCCRSRGALPASFPSTVCIHPYRILFPSLYRPSKHDLVPFDASSAFVIPAYYSCLLSIHCPLYLILTSFVLYPLRIWPSILPTCPVFSPFTPLAATTRSYLPCKCLSSFVIDIALRFIHCDLIPRDRHTPLVSLSLTYPRPLPYGAYLYSPSPLPSVSILPLLLLNLPPPCTTLSVHPPHFHGPQQHPDAHRRLCPPARRHQLSRLNALAVAGGTVEVEVAAGMNAFGRRRRR
ncbi:hypothetical protein C8F01DRAFT_274722 [Mycena amicta]|nr:hypothetical protein C8F01DRAFT_274722 [Mycena amicta]